MVIVLSEDAGRSTPFRETLGRELLAVSHVDPAHRERTMLLWHASGSVAMLLPLLAAAAMRMLTG